MLILSILFAAAGFGCLVLAVGTGDVLWLMILVVAVFMGFLTLLADARAKRKQDKGKPKEKS